MSSREPMGGSGELKQRVAEMRAAGVGEPSIALWLGEHATVRIAPGANVSIGGSSVPIEHAGYVHVTDNRLDFPIRLTLPWSHLCSDNAKYGAVVRGGKPRLIHTEAYRAAKAATQKKAREAMSVGPTRFEALAMPLRLNARVFLPDARIHDVANMAKCCHDALEKIVFANDHWLHHVTWERAGVDVDAPRAEIEIRPL